MHTGTDVCCDDVAGMMLSVKVPIKASLEGEVGGEHAEGAAAPAGETPEDEDIIEEVEEDAEIAEEDVAFTWSHFFLLILFVASCTVVMFYFIKVCSLCRGVHA
jgi:hypothetical protein